MEVSEFFYHSDFTWNQTAKWKKRWHFLKSRKILFDPSAGKSIKNLWHPLSSFEILFHLKMMKREKEILFFLYKGEKKRCYKRRRIDCHWKSFHSETQHSVKISKIYSHIMLYQFLTSNILINTRNWFHVIFFQVRVKFSFFHTVLSLT